MKALTVVSSLVLMVAFQNCADSGFQVRTEDSSVYQSVDETEGVSTGALPLEVSNGQIGNGHTGGNNSGSNNINNSSNNSHSNNNSVDNGSGNLGVGNFNNNGQAGQGQGQVQEQGQASTVEKKPAVVQGVTLVCGPYIDEDATIIASWYKQELKRCPEPAGLEYWYNQYQSVRTQITIGQFKQHYFDTNIMVVNFKDCIKGDSSEEQVSSCYRETEFQGELLDLCPYGKEWIYRVGTNYCTRD